MSMQLLAVGILLFLSAAFLLAWYWTAPNCGGYISSVSRQRSDRLMLFGFAFGLIGMILGLV